VTVAGLVLAAGAGRRFGQPKALVSLHGELLVERAVRTAVAGDCDPVLVVLGSHADEVVAGTDLGTARTVLAANWAEGMGASLRAGLEASAYLGCKAVVVMLVDQPLVSAEALRRLVDAWRAGAVAAVATYDGKPRNPVVLDHSIWAEVAVAAVGDVGARGWLRSHPEQVVAVPCDGSGDPIDIDTPNDLIALEAL
jgi:CTP:molybdopterin cytidylyltransferase MocA